MCVRSLRQRLRRDSFVRDLNEDLKSRGISFLSHNKSHNSQMALCLLCLHRAMPFTKFDRYVDRHARSFTERLQSLCRMPSVAARGTGMRAIAETVEQMMQRVGIGTRSFRIGQGIQSSTASVAAVQKRLWSMVTTMCSRSVI